MERSQRTDRMEFWATVNIRAGREALAAQVLEWQRFYNRERGHGSFGGKTPASRLEELRAAIPAPEAVRAAYDPKTEVYKTSSTGRWGTA